MAGLGIGPDQFATFRIVDPDERERALESAVLPALSRVGDGLLAGLSRLAAASLVQQHGKLQHRKGAPPEEVLVAFCAAEKLHQKAPHLALAATRGHLHARVAARAAADRDGAIRRAVQREAPNLARKGKPFRKLRSYVAWEPDHDELPEVAPAHSAAFWEEIAEGLARDRNGSGGIDLGTAWTAEEARSLALGDVLGAFRDLSSLYKLFAAAR